MRNRNERGATAESSPQDMAAFWRVRQDCDDMTAQESADFEQWLAACPENGAAWRATANVWELFENAADPHLDAMRTAARAARQEPRSWWTPLAAALALVAFCIGLIGLAQSGSFPIGSGGSSTHTFRYETQRGERATATLADGTVVNLDSDTALDVTLEQARRQVRLSRGQALFEVAKDKHRPFVVQADRSAVTALGTMFDVKLATDVLQVVLVEGRVAVHTSTEPRSPSVILTPGHELTATGSGDIRVRAVDTEAALLWRQGLVEFDDVTLAEAITQLNQRFTRPLRLADKGVASMRLSGVYRTGSPEGFVASIAQVLPVEGRVTPEGVRIQRKKNSN